MSAGKAGFFSIRRQADPIEASAGNNPDLNLKGPDVSASDKPMDVPGIPRQTMSLPVLLQVAGVLSAIAVTYSTMVANDREHATAIAQLQRDVARIEKDTKDLKVEILGELREIRNELRERQKGR